MADQSTKVLEGLGEYRNQAVLESGLVFAPSRNALSLQISFGLVMTSPFMAESGRAEHDQRHIIMLRSAFGECLGGRQDSSHGLQSW